MAVLLGVGVRGTGILTLARNVSAVIRERGSRDVGMEALAAVKGLGKTQALRILAALEIGRRRFSTTPSRIEHPRDLLPLLRHLVGKRQEHLICVSLDGAHDILASRVVAVGLVDRTMVHPREVYADAITDRASAIVMAHNHPARILSPSAADLEVTARVRKAGVMLGIPLIDHIIFDERSYFSFSETWGPSLKPRRRVG